MGWVGLELELELELFQLVLVWGAFWGAVVSLLGLGLVHVLAVLVTLLGFWLAHEVPPQFPPVLLLLLLLPWLLACLPQLPFPFADPFPPALPLSWSWAESTHAPTISGVAVLLPSNLLNLALSALASGSIGTPRGFDLNVAALSLILDPDADLAAFSFKSSSMISDLGRLDSRRFSSIAGSSMVVWSISSMMVLSRYWKTKTA